VSTPTAFHRRFAGYAPTPRVDAPGLAAELGVGRLLVKDESSRLGLPAFKMLGASWASYRALVVERQRVTGTPLPDWTTLDDLAALLEPLHPIDLATATDGNHGRAVARFARLMGMGARIFVPAGTSDARIAAIEGEGASCTVVDGTYDDAVARAAKEASDEPGDRCLVISDTSWPGYDVVPAWVIDGYATIFAEIEDQLSAAGRPAPDVVLVPIGVGAFAAAAAQWYRRAGLVDPPVLIGVEPDTANCVMASARAGRLVEVPGPHRSVMAGLNCGEASPVAWPFVSTGFDWFVAGGDDLAEQGMRLLASAGIVSGESGASTVGALAALRSSPDGPAIGPDTVVLALSTEGATDPAFYEQVVGRTPAEVASG
jgi:diaminopropionate ammonia-lyase